MDEEYLLVLERLDNQADFVAERFSKKYPIFKELAPELEKLCVLV